MNERNPQHRAAQDRHGGPIHRLWMLVHGYRWREIMVIDSMTYKGNGYFHVDRGHAVHAWVRG